MTVSEVLVMAASESVFLTLAPDGSIDLTPPRRASKELRNAIREHKPSIVAKLGESRVAPASHGTNGHVRGPPKPEEPLSNFTRVPNAFYELPREKNLDASSIVVLDQLGRLTFGFGMHSPNLVTTVSIHKLAIRCNFSPATCNRALHSLVKAGVIERVQRTDKGGKQVASMIRILF